MEQITTFRSLMQSPRLLAILSVIVLLALRILNMGSSISSHVEIQERTWIPRYSETSQHRSNIWHRRMVIHVSKHEKPPAVAKDPLSISGAGANTMSILVAEQHKINTIEPENYKAILSTHFSSFKFPSRRTYVLKQFMGNASFSSHGPTWQHSRAIIRPYLTRDSFVDDELSRFEKYLDRRLKTIPGDRSTFDLQPLFFAFTMNAAIKLLTGKDLQSEEQLAFDKDGNNVSFNFSGAVRSFVLSRVQCQCPTGPGTFYS
jgi:cytochrome P450